MSKPFEAGQQAELTIDRIAYGGDGVGHPDGFAVFVPRTAPGDKVVSEFTKVKKRFGKAVPVKIIEAGPNRIEPKCKHYVDCGGCHYQHLSEDYVRKLKVEHLRDSLERLGPGSHEISPLIAPENPWTYRGKVTYHRSGNGAQGYVGWRTNNVVDIDECLIAPDDLNHLWEKTRKLISDTPAKHLPYVVLRATTAGDRAIILSVVCESNQEIDFEEMKTKTEPLATQASVHVTLIKPGSRLPFGPTLRTLHGQKVVKENINGLVYTLAPSVFFQVHPEITKLLVQHVIGIVQSCESHHVLDLFCGAGLFTLALANQKIPTLGVEVQNDAVQSALASTKENKLGAYATFRSGKVDRILDRLVKSKETFDTCIVDPPRKGIDPKALQTLPKLGIQNIIYISCSPPTLARDLKDLVNMGYKIQTIQPYDMFPNTYHMETIICLKKNA